MKRLMMALALAAFVVGCTTTAQRTVYNTLASVQVATTSAYSGYLDLVVRGSVSTNMVPTVARDYDKFQLVWNSAVTVAQWNTNAFATADVNAASVQVLNDIIIAKGMKP